MASRVLSDVTSAAGLILLALSACADDELVWSTVKRQIHKELPKVRHISGDELSARLESAERSPLVLDVRQLEEYEVSHLRGAIHVEPGAAEPLAGMDIDRHMPIVTYCSVGYRSAQLAHRLEELGFTDVANLEGSIFEWANRGRPVVRDGVEVRQVHPYNRRWGRLLDAELHAYAPE